MNCVVLKTYPPRLTIENPPLTIDSDAQEKTRILTEFWDLGANPGANSLDISWISSFV
jgi:hypothetical protein